MYGVDLRIEFSEAEDQSVEAMQEFVDKTFGRGKWKFNRSEAQGDCLFAIFEYRG